jgi:hypothetical protein
MALRQWIKPPQRWNSTWLFAIWLFGSEPITTANFMRMFPYGLARLNDEHFASAVQHGYLLADGKIGYTPTESGMKAAQRVWREAGDSIASLNSMPDDQLGRLFEYLARLGESALSAPEPPPHYFMSHKRENYQHFKVLYPLERFVVLFGELAAYRDDCYISTWGAHGIDGHAWDAFDQLVQSGALTQEDLFAKVKRRGITEEIHVEDIKELIGRGWVEEGSGVYQITSVGKQVRVEVEAQTERSFFAPWSCLSETELKDLLELSIQLGDSLKEGRNRHGRDTSH